MAGFEVEFGGGGGGGGSGRGRGTGRGRDEGKEGIVGEKRGGAGRDLGGSSVLEITSCPRGILDLDSTSVPNTRIYHI